MAKKADAPVLPPPPPVVDVETFLARAGAKERAKIEKHLALRDSEVGPGYSKLWRRISAVLGGLAPMPAQTMGNLAVLFFIPDGKYRMQVFALEDAGDGKLSIYLPDVMAAALKKKVLLKEKAPGEFSIGGAASSVVHLELLDASNTTSPHPHVKNLIGWNRKAIRVILPSTDADGPQVGAAEALCELAAKNWAKAPVAK
ncbi:MAG TPA: hypothetical protein VG326_04020 [Tepidisphaeraceae bacterium]|jgi:hypothetical protein|nr:hypothetical protein [Tepidisphaeraceae bacterium]